MEWNFGQKVCNNAQKLQKVQPKIFWGGPHGDDHAQHRGLTNCLKQFVGAKLTARLRGGKEGNSRRQLRRGCC